MVPEREGGGREGGKRMIDGETGQQAATAGNGETTSSTANRKQKETWKWGEAVTLTGGLYFLQVHPPRQHPCWAPDIQISEPMKDILIQTKALCFWSFFILPAFLGGRLECVHSCLASRPTACVCVSVSRTECFTVYGKCGEPLRELQRYREFFSFKGDAMDGHRWWLLL